MPRALVTGSNRGIGLELCRQLKERGYEVIAACRRRSEALDALDVEVHTEVDVTDDTSVAALAGRVEGRSLDLLVNNAGILTRETLDDMNFEQMRRQFEVNALGPLRVTTALRTNLPRGSKIGLITSRMGSIGDNTSGSRYGYRMSKAALNIAGVSLAQDLRPSGVAVAILHPGLVATDMVGGHGIPPAESVGGLLARIDGLTLENSGTFWHAQGEILPW